MTTAVAENTKLRPLVEVVNSRTPVPVSSETARRWALRGVRTRSGELVKLKATRVVGRLFATAEAVDEFLAATT